jgi:hypothetical protein
VDHAREGDGEFDGGLGCFYLADDLAVGDGVAGVDEPADDLGVLEAFAHVGHQELPVVQGGVTHRQRSPQ